jgi:hypothetical protein
MSLLNPQLNATVPTTISPSFDLLCFICCALTFTDITRFVLLCCALFIYYFLDELTLYKPNTVHTISPVKTGISPKQNQHKLN